MIEKNLSNLISKQEEPVKYITFSGGGAKGAVYSGVYEALHENSVLDQVKAVSGTSAGALTATLVATGVDVDKLKILMQKMDFTDLLGENTGLVAYKDGVPLREFIREQTLANVADFFKQNPDINELCSKRLENINSVLDDLTQTEKVLQQLMRDTNIDYKEDIANLQNQVGELLGHQNIIEKIINQNSPEFEDLVNRVKQENSSITFRDLSLLNALEPKRFKDVIITAVDKEKGELRLFNSENSPKVTLEDAAAASAALPVIFKPVVIEGREYIDGGYINNLPTNYFDSNKKTLTEESSYTPNNGRTLVFAFANSDKSSSFKALYGSPKPADLNGTTFGFFKEYTKDFFDSFLRFALEIGGKVKYTDSKVLYADNIRKNSNTILLNTYDVGTVSFKKASDKFIFLHNKGNSDANKYLDFLGIARPEISKKTFVKDFTLDLLHKMQKSETSFFFGLDKDRKKEYDKIISFIDNKKNTPESLIKELVAFSFSKQDKKLVDVLLQELNSKQTADIVKETFASVFDIKEYQSDDKLITADKLIGANESFDDFELIF